jgi:hypothetical protein
LFGSFQPLALLPQPFPASLSRLYLEKTHRKKGLVEWLKVKALNSNLSTAKKKRKK